VKAETLIWYAGVSTSWEGPKAKTHG
jgi:hypothetical protein